MRIQLKAGVEPWQVLKALVNRASPLGFGFRDPNARSVMTDEAAVEYTIKSPDSWDYVWGRPIKVKIKGHAFITEWFDRDAGKNAALQACMDADLVEDYSEE